MSDEQFLRIPEPPKSWREWCAFACAMREERAELQHRVRTLKKWAPSVDIEPDSHLPEICVMIRVTRATIGFARDRAAVLKHIGNHVEWELYRYLKERGHLG